MSIINLYEKDQAFVKSIPVLPSVDQRVAIRWLDDVRYHLQSDFHKIDQVSEHDFLAKMHRAGLSPLAAYESLLKYRKNEKINKPTIPDELGLKAKPETRINKQLELF